MTPVSAVLTPAIWLLLMFPGVLLLFGVLPRRSPAEVFFAGGVTGWCLQILLLRLFGLSAWPFVTGFLYVAALAACFRTLRKAPEERPRRLPGGYVLWVSAVIALAAFLPLAMVGDLPPGEHSMFHMLLVKKSLLDGFPPRTLLPIASIPVNAPAGTHLWAALVAKVAGIEPHHSFKMSFPVIAFFTAGMIYLLALEIFDGDKYVAFFSSLLFALTGAFGGGDLFLEGRLPHFMGMLLLLCLLWFMLTEPRLRGRLLMGLAGAGILYCQHHTILVAAGMAVGVFTIERMIHGRFGEWSRSLAVAAVVAVALAPEQVLTGLGLLFNPGATDLYTYREVFVPLGELIKSPGSWLAFTGLAGLGLLFFRLKSDRRLLVVMWIAMLLGMLATFGYLYRVLVFGFKGEFYAMFTPSALMESLKYPLYIAGGWFIASREGFFRLRGAGLVVFAVAVVALKFTSGGGEGGELGRAILARSATILIAIAVLLWLFGASRKNKAFRVVTAAILTLILLLPTAVGVVAHLNTFKNIMPAPENVDKEMLKRRVPPGALVMNRPVNPYDRTLYGWVPYLTWNDSTYIVLPSTEPRNCEELEYKREILEHDLYEMQIQGHLQAKPVVLITPPAAKHDRLGYEDVYTSGRRKVSVYEP